MYNNIHQKEIPKYKIAISSWWSSLDKVTLFLVIWLMIIGSIMSASASLAVAERIKASSNMFFIKKQLLYLFCSISIMILISFLNEEQIKKTILILTFLFVLMLIAVLIFGTPIKGSKRWLNLWIISLQPSEFIKPLFAVTSAIFLSKTFLDENYPGFVYSLSLYILIVSLLILEPDFGMSVTLTIIWFSQIFIAGLPLFWIACIIILAVFALILTFLFIPHVAYRIDIFLKPNNETMNYQVTKSLEAYKNGGFLGKGLGDGSVKRLIPDAHTDFIFPVIAEELGVVGCIIIIIMFAILIFRNLRMILKFKDMFKILALSGLLAQITMQTIFNIGVSLNLFPTKGMTLPLISCGGSSSFATAILVGVILALNKNTYALDVKFNYLLRFKANKSK